MQLGMVGDKKDVHVCCDYGCGQKPTGNALGSVSAQMASTCWRE
jgi:hypothetical protein